MSKADKDLVAKRHKASMNKSKRHQIKSVRKAAKNAIRQQDT
jgi:hypothetical protein